MVKWDFLAQPLIGVFSPLVMELRKPTPFSVPTVPNPKRGTSSCSKSSWFPYYAGYSTEFVQSILQSGGNADGATLLDPWNGAGTTTQVGFDLGWNVVGFDINPVMAVVARSRLTRIQQLPAIRTRARAAMAIAKASRREASLPDTLTQWFQLPAVNAIRSLSRAIEDVCELGETTIASKADAMDETTAFLFVCLFSAVRSLSEKARCSNPTWTLRIRDGRSKIWFERHTLIEQFSETVSSFLEGYGSESSARVFRGPTTAVIQTADSRMLPCLDGSIDLVVTSPPYCTRIDYSITTAIESAVAFGHLSASEQVNRDEFMGTSTIRPAESIPDKEIFSGYVLEAIQAINSHPSYASESYYAKTYRQYFFDLVHSLAELARAVKTGGKAVLVVQDSYYKDLHVDLARACVETLSGLDFTLVQQADFPVTSDLAAINSKSKPYRTLSTKHVESVVILEKKG